MSEEAKKFLADIRHAIELLEDFLGEITSFLEYQKDLKTKSAVERQLGIIGEAVNQYRKLEDNKELSHTRQIVDFRNRLIHSYDNIDDAIVWVIIKKHIPTLKEEVQKELENE
ncbi:HepT-like ribonuclease domain-containing protein [Tunicatimonas pelagia]|uniref:HepT-like ribonuclease domain-containing protein n=1 Tax=Tunicatimonas pelagia TaxID=931531 RepID=UPI0026655A5C|nr:HepT-like ribonuclease domain-containing protein [Tunicatimonas pelagia]WKN42099.1 DUF86 domain-containing protein [Tunicatimonas pelagia]